MHISCAIGRSPCARHHLGPVTGGKGMNSDRLEATIRRAWRQRETEIGWLRGCVPKVPGSACFCRPPTSGNKPIGMGRRNSVGKRRGGNAGARSFGGGAGVSPRGLLTDVHALPNFITLSYSRTRKTLRRARYAPLCSCSANTRSLRGPGHARPARFVGTLHPQLALKLWIILCFSCPPVWLLPSYDHPQSSFELHRVVAVYMWNDFKKALDQLRV